MLPPFFCGKKKINKLRLIINEDWWEISIKIKKNVPGAVLTFQAHSPGETLQVGHGQELKPVGFLNI